MWFWPIDKRRFIYVLLFGWRVNWPLDNLKLVIGNCLPGILALVWTRFQGKQHLRDLLSNVFAWRTQPKWYALSIGLPCATFIASLCMAMLILPAKISWPPISVFVLSLVILPFGPLWEEVAWRAFALRRLQTRYSCLVSALIIGAYWTIWHIPMWMLTLNYLTWPLLIIICINLIAWSVVFAFLYNRSGQSLPVVILLHETYQTVQNEVAAALSNVSQVEIIILVQMVLAVCLASFFGRKLRTYDESLTCAKAAQV